MFVDCCQIDFLFHILIWFLLILYWFNNQQIIKTTVYLMNCCHQRLGDVKISINYIGQKYLDMWTMCLLIKNIFV